MYATCDCWKSANSKNVAYLRFYAYLTYELIPTVSLEKI